MTVKRTNNCLFFILNSSEFFKFGSIIKKINNFKIGFRGFAEELTMNLYKDLMELVGTFAIVAILVLVVGTRNLSALLPCLGLLMLIVSTPTILKRNSKESRKKVILIQASVVVVLVGLILDQTFSVGPVSLLLSLMIGAILFSISLRVSAKPPVEIVKD